MRSALWIVTCLIAAACSATGPTPRPLVSGFATSAGSGKANEAGEIGIGAREPFLVAPLAGTRPVMTIYGESDPYIPFQEQIRIVAASGTPNATWAWRAPGAGHLEAYEKWPGEYRARVVEFLDAAMVEWWRRGE